MKVIASYVSLCLLSPACANRSEGLNKLRGELEEVRAAPASALPINRGGDMDPSFLIGMSADEVRTHLGKGLPCAGYRESEINKLRSQEKYCEEYRFYRLPPDYGGGGNLLALYYSAELKCLRAQWWNEM
jgi:hypothetical protein